MRLQESGEMYLEAILVLSKEKASVRSIDIVEYMGYSKPSVSRAVGLLKQGGFITMTGEGLITLSAEGAEVAQKIYDRHTLLTECLMLLGVDRDTAVEDACKMEHNISDRSYEAIKTFIENNRRP